MPNADISKKIGVKISSVASIIHLYKYGKLTFEMSDDDYHDNSKKLKPEIVSFISNMVYGASENK